MLFRQLSKIISFATDSIQFTQTYFFLCPNFVTFFVPNAIGKKYAQKLQHFQGLWKTINIFSKYFDSVIFLFSFSWLLPSLLQKNTYKKTFCSDHVFDAEGLPTYWEYGTLLCIYDIFTPLFDIGTPNNTQCTAILSIYNIITIFCFIINWQFKCIMWIKIYSASSNWYDSSLVNQY